MRLVIRRTLTPLWCAERLPPSADMPDPLSQDESVSLTSVVWQDHDNNRHVWADIEHTVCRFAVPVALYNAVYLPGFGATG